MTVELLHPPKTAATMPIDQIKVGARHRRDMGDVDGLAASIAEVGLLHAPVVTPDGTLVAGARRLQAVQKLGWTDVPVRVVNLSNHGEIVRGELAENADRKDFLPSEIDAIRRVLEPVEKAAAASRKLSGRSAPNGGEARDKIGALAGVSGRQVEKIAQVMKAAEANPTKFAQIVEEMDRTGRVDRAYKAVVTAAPAKPKPKANGKTTTAALTDQALIDGFSDIEWTSLAAVSVAVRAYLGLDDLSRLDDDEFAMLHKTLIEARERFDAFVGEVEAQFEPVAA